MDLLVIGNTYLIKALSEEHRVVSAGFGPDFDITVTDHFCDFERDILSKMPADFSPDLALFCEGPQQLFPIGLEKSPVLLAWHAMDTHVNSSWHYDYAALFDYLFICQKDYIPGFERASDAAVLFTPLACDPALNRRENSTKEYDLVFVGTVHADYFERTDYLQFFQQHLGLQVFSHVFGAEMNRLFNQARIVLNHPVRGDLNFRVFEAMASGSLLLTPRSGNGLCDLFTDGRDCVMFDPRKPMEGVEKARYYLAHEVERERIARSGNECVMQKHTRTQRAREMITFIKDHRRPRKMSAPGVYKQLGKAYHVIDQLAFERDQAPRYQGVARRSSLQALQTYIEREPSDPEGYHLVGMCLCARAEIEKAYTFFIQAITIDPSFVPARIGAGVIDLKKNDHDQAFHHFAKAFQVDPRAARSVLESVYLQHGNPFLGYVNLGHILLRIGMVDAAIEYFHNAVALDERDSALLSSLGFAYLKKADRASAKKYFLKALELDPEDARLKERVASLG